MSQERFFIREDFIASGFHAEVRRINPQEKKYFPLMEVCREESAILQKRAKILFYFHQISQLLFPENFLYVGAATFRPLLPQYFLTFIYSKLVNLSDHALFSTHAQPEIFDALGLGSGKQFSCDCEICSRHRQFHQSWSYRLKLGQTVRKLQNAGLLVPQDDLSDHCRQKNSQIIFFEIEAINPEKIRKYLWHKQKLSPRIKKRAERILSRTESFFDKNKNEWFYLPLFI